MLPCVQAYYYILFCLGYPANNSPYLINPGVQDPYLLNQINLGIYIYTYIIYIYLSHSYICLFIYLSMYLLSTHTSYLSTSELSPNVCIYLLIFLGQIGVPMYVYLYPFVSIYLGQNGVPMYVSMSLCIYLSIYISI